MKFIARRIRLMAFSTKNWPFASVRYILRKFSFEQIWPWIKILMMIDGGDDKVAKCAQFYSNYSVRAQNQFKKNPALPLHCQRDWSQILRDRSETQTLRYIGIGDSGNIQRKSDSGNCEQIYKCTDTLASFIMAWRIILYCTQLIECPNAYIHYTLSVYCVLFISLDIYGRLFD